MEAEVKAGDHVAEEAATDTGREAKYEVGIVDLHCHTKASDNSMTAREVARTAREAGVHYLAITDHDTTIGLEAAVEAGRAERLMIIPGIEISAYDFERNRKAHILGYGIVPGHEALARVCEPVVRQRHEASRLAFDKIVEAGYAIRWEQVIGHAAGGSAVYKQHLMHALMERGYCDTLNGDLYRRLFAPPKPDAEAGIAYVPIRYADAREAILAVRAAGGVPVLAHPGQQQNYDGIGEWVQAGLEGIEVVHPSHTPEEEEKGASYARRFGLLETGGSDYHGMYGSAKYPLGSKDAGMDRLRELLRRIEGHRYT
jgi:predicted metal-dependent phosphoesterase TrpH